MYPLINDNFDAEQADIDFYPQSPLWKFDEVTTQASIVLGNHSDPRSWRPAQTVVSSNELACVSSLDKGPMHW